MRDAIRDMRTKENKIRSFTDLEAWQIGHEFVIEIYNITRNFPKHETFGLVNQLRRSVCSVTSNIAEGFSRFSYKERNRFYYIARGSISESHNHLLISRDLGYLNDPEATVLISKAERIRQIINGLIRSTQNLINP